MVSTRISPSRSSNLSSSSQASLNYAPSSPSSSNDHSASSSKLSLDQHDEENATITRPLSRKFGKQRSQEDLRLLAISTHMTEISYAISDIQTRIFEIQELRHKSQSSGDSTRTTNVIDQSLMGLDERLDVVEKGMKSISDLIQPFTQPASTPTFPYNKVPDENALILRKHAALISEWEAVQDESDVLREELREDKWLTVFRTVTDQADGMMSSLEKAVSRCQDFIWEVHRRGVGDLLPSQPSLSTSQFNEKPLRLTIEVFTSLFDSFEAKKRHYMPATSKVLSIIDKGVRDRVTKNGETLRRHAESAQRWRNLRERISRTDTEMENVRRVLMVGEATPSENGSSTSGTTSTKNAYLATPPSGPRASRAPSSASTLSRSISPFRKFARKITRTNRGSPVTPSATNKINGNRTPSSEPIPGLRRPRTTAYNPVGEAVPPMPITPDRLGHKYSQSLTPDSSPQTAKVDANSTVKSRAVSNKQRWNSSTKVDPEERSATIRGTPPRRPPSSLGWSTNSNNIPPVPSIATPHKRSSSRASVSRPFTPVTSSISTTSSSQPYHFLNLRPPSRAQTPAHGVAPGLNTTPRPRPKTPSHIPQPLKQIQTTPGPSENSDDDDSPRLRRVFSPTFSVSSMSVTSSGFAHPPRPPSRSMIPVPSVHLSSPSRPTSAMSDYIRMDISRGPASRAQTPEHALRARVQQVPFFFGTSGRAAGRPSINKLPPSSFKDGTASRTPSRPGSRVGVHTSAMDNIPVYEYIPGNIKDPLDVEVAAIVNSMFHGLLVERIDPPLRKLPKDGEEIKAQYAFSSALNRKVVTCRLTTLSRPGRTSGETTTKKVMCRIGGGWQDLGHYILNRQAGL